jgi:hypothetical protein
MKRKTVKVPMFDAFQIIQRAEHDRGRKLTAPEIQSMLVRYLNVTSKAAKDFAFSKVKKNPRKRKSSARTRYESNRQMERLGRNIAASRVTKRSVHSGLKLQRKARRALTVVRRNPRPKKYVIEANVREGQKLHYRFWNGSMTKSAFVSNRMRGKTWHSKTAAAAEAKKILPYLASKVISLRVVAQ